MDCELVDSALFNPRLETLQLRFHTLFSNVLQLRLCVSDFKVTFDDLKNLQISVNTAFQVCEM